MATTYTTLADLLLTLDPAVLGQLAQRLPALARQLVALQAAIDELSPAPPAPYQCWQCPAEYPYVQYASCPQCGAATVPF